MDRQTEAELEAGLSQAVEALELIRARVAVLEAENKQLKAQKAALEQQAVSLQAEVDALKEQISTLLQPADEAQED